MESLTNNYLVNKCTIRNFPLYNLVVTNYITILFITKSPSTNPHLELHSWNYLVVMKLKVTGSNIPRTPLIGCIHTRMCRYKHINYNANVN